MAGSRFAYRIWKEHRLYSPLEALGEPVLIIGAGEAGARLAKDLARSRQWRVVGLLDDDPAKQGRLLRNVQRAGADRRSFRAWCEKYGVRKVIIALPSANHVVRRRVAELCAGAGVEALTVPVVRGPDQRASRAHDDPQRRTRRPARPRSGRARQRGAGRMARQPRGDGDRRGRLDRRRARRARSRASVPRGSCCSTFRRRRSTRSRPRSPTRSRSCRWSAVVGDVKHAALVEDVLAREKPERHLPRGRVQARAADGGDERVAGGAQQRVRHVGARARRRRRRASRNSCSCRPTRRSTRPT